MKHITYTCDKCGKRIENAKVIPIGGIDEEVDLCNECFTKLRTMVTNWLKEDTDDGTKKIDDGKVAALRRAGWTIQAIAEEIGCSKPTVIKHLKDMGVEKGDES